MADFFGICCNLERGANSNDSAQPQHRAADSGFMSYPALGIYPEQQQHRQPRLLRVTSPTSVTGTATQHNALSRAAIAPAKHETSQADAQILAVLDAPPALGETLEAAFRRKERELREVFARVSVNEARALHRRLSNPTVGDAVAARFSRLLVDRQSRLLVFLADARRREALAIASR